MLSWEINVPLGGAHRSRIWSEAAPASPCLPHPPPPASGPGGREDLPTAKQKVQHPQRMEAAVGTEGRRSPPPLGSGLWTPLGGWVLGGWEPQTHHPQALRTTAHGRGVSVRRGRLAPRASPSRGEQRLSVRLHSPGCPAGRVSEEGPQELQWPWGQGAQVSEGPGGQA